MSQRASGRARVANERYETPDFATGAFCAHFPVNGRLVWEPAAGTGKMVRSFLNRGAYVINSDIERVSREDDLPFQAIGDFTSTLLPVYAAIEAMVVSTGFGQIDTIATNPPYGHAGKLAESFARRGLAYLRERKADRLALLLRADFDSAGTRVDLFRDCPEFCARIVMLERINWFPPAPGEGGSSTNHSWFVWDRSFANIAGRRAQTLYSS